MRMRRFVGADPVSVLQAVKDALGPDALVLETRGVPGGGVEILAACDPAAPDGARPAAAEPSGAVRRTRAAVRTPGGSYRPRSASSHPRTEALVGPPGDGKTTTAAKLAARAAAEGARPGLVVADDRRIGAAAQLGSIARLLDVPLRIARDRDELAECLEALADCDRIWIDCAGVCSDPAHALELRELLSGAGEPVLVTAVLGSTASHGSLTRAWRALGPLEPDGCVLTKLDLAGDGEQVRAWLDRTGVALRWLATGQDPLGDLAPAHANELELWLGAA